MSPEKMARHEKSSPLDEIRVAEVLAKTFVTVMEYHQVIDSTNNRAKELALSSETPLPFLVLAERQTAGKGRGSRRWWTGPGSLACSVVGLLQPAGLGRGLGEPSGLSGQGRRKTAFQRPPGSADSSSLPSGGAILETNPNPDQRQTAEDVLPAQFSQTWQISASDVRYLGLAGALAVFDAARKFLPPGVSLGIHWPNDVYAAKRKLAGILVEITSNDRAVIGIGVNVNNSSDAAPEELRPNLTSLIDLTGQRLDRTTVLVEILHSLERHLALIGKDAQSLARLADEFCLQKGRRLTLEHDGQSITGKCAGIEQDGSLILETAQGPQHFLSGSVVAMEE